MKITLQCQDFLNVANVIAKSINTKDAQGQTVIKVDDTHNQLIIQHKSSVSFFKGSVAISELSDLSETKQWGVDGNQLKIILSVIPREEQSITIEVSQDGRLFLVKLSRSQLKLPIYENISNVYDENVHTLGSVAAGDFITNLQNLLKLTVSDEVVQEHPVSCIHLLGTEEDLSFVSTNTIALVERKVPLSDVSEPFTVLLKGNQANLLNTSRFNPEDTISLYGSITMFGYVDNYGTLCLVNKANIDPLEYLAFKDAVRDTEQISFDTEPFRYAIEATAKLCANANELKLTFENNKLTIENLNGDKIDILVQGQVQNTIMNMNKDSLSILCNHVFSHKINMCWEGTEGQRIVQFKNILRENNQVDPHSFIIITTQ